MPSLSDEFQVLLPRNVNSNPRNEPNLYDTELAKPLDLPDDWYVALINISYLHNWTNFDKSYQYFLLRLSSGVDSEFAPDNNNDQTYHYDFILTQAQFRCCVVDRAQQIARNNYDTSKIL